MSLYSYTGSKPEPMASLADIISASQALEAAIHSSNRIMAMRSLREAATQISHAQAYFQTGGYLDLEEEARKAVDSLNVLAGEALTTSDFTDFRESTLYDFQSVLGQLFFSTFKLFRV